MSQRAVGCGDSRGPTSGWLVRAGVWKGGRTALVCLGGRGRGAESPGDVLLLSIRGMEVFQNYH
eukprot:scaffold242916_cov27-Tisochrysis_lutea.AAC.1